MNYVIGLGCSFTQGQGTTPHWNRDDAIERERSYVNQLAKLLDYQSINLAECGVGGRSNILKLLLLDLPNAENIVVVYQQTGGQRFDWNSYYASPRGGVVETHTDYGKDGMQKNIWSGQYRNDTDFTEQIMNILILENWCKLHNAELIIWSAYDEFTTPFHIKKYLEGTECKINFDNWWLIDDNEQMTLYEYVSNYNLEEFKGEDAEINSWHPNEKCHKWIAEQLLRVLESR